MPREDRFFELYNRHAQTLVDGAVALPGGICKAASVSDAAHKIFAIEAQADAITREVLILVRRSFITPFDRGDIKELINTLDDTVDQMQKTAKAVLLFEVETIEPEMVEMGVRISQAATLTAEAVRLWRPCRARASSASPEEIIRLEDDADTLNDIGVKALFKNHREGNAMAYIIGVEIYDHLEKVMDRFEDVANRISGIVIEQA